MAYQPKSYKKFVATAATATLVATAVVPAAFADEVKPAAFTDVAKQYEDAVNFVVAQNIAKGLTETTFGVSAQIKRGDAAIMIANAAKLNDEKAPASGFSDVPTRGVLAINSLKAAGVINGKSATNFGFNDSITRGEAAIMLTNAFKLTGDTNTVPFTDVSDRYLKAVAALVENDVTNGISATQFGTANNIKRGDFARFVYALEEYIVVEDPTGTPQVATATPINATQVLINFNTEVDKDSAELEANYKINSNSPSAAVLNDDKKSVTLTFATPAQVEVENAVLSVEPIETAANASISTTKYVQVLSYEDKVNPLVTSVQAKTNGTVANTLTVKASEPIANSLAKVNGEYYAVDFKGTDTATISGLALETNKSHTIELINLTDKGGNVTVSTSATFNVSVDTVAPTATLSTKGDKGILVTFSKPMNVASVEAALAAGNNPVKDETLANVSTQNATVVADSNDTQFLIPVSSTLYANKDSRTLTVVLPATATDKLGNKLAATTQSVVLTKDSAKPVATGYNVIKNADGEVTDIEVVFNEGLAANANPTEPTIVNENGVAIANGDFLGGLIADPIVAGDKKVTYAVSTPDELTGKFAFSFPANLVTDQAETGNKSDAFNYTIDFGAGASTFKLVSATASNNVITVDFGRGVKGGAVSNSATDVSNYTLGGKPLPAGTTIVLNAGQTAATITLPADTIAKNDQAAVFTVSNVQALNSGALLSGYTGTVSVTDNVKPLLNSAALTSDNQLVVGFNETLSPSPVIADFVLEVNGKAVTATGTNTLTVSAGTGSDVGKYLINLDDLVIQGTAPVLDNVDTPDVDETRAATATFFDVNNNGTYEAATDIRIADGPVKDFKFSSSSAITSVDISTKETGATVAKDAAGNSLKNDVEVSAK